MVDHSWRAADGRRAAVRRAGIKVFKQNVRSATIADVTSSLPLRHPTGERANIDDQ